MTKNRIQFATINDQVRNELQRRIDLYLQVATDKELVEDEGLLPLWLVICQLFDMVSAGDVFADLEVRIRNGKIPSMIKREEKINPYHESSQYSNLIDELKRKL